jgi:hypothetical protein
MTMGTKKAHETWFLVTVLFVIQFLCQAIARGYVEQLS